MGESSGKAREIDLGEDFGDVVVKANGAQVTISADGSFHGIPAPANDDLIKTVLPVFRELARTQKLLPYPPLPEADEIELREGIAEAKAALRIGAIESTGEHKGEIYGGIWTKEYGGDNKPIWFSQLAPKLMNHYNAAAWATEQGGALPTMKQGDYLKTLKGKGGAFTELFNRGGSFPAGYVWLAEPYASGRNTAWCQRLSDGYQELCKRKFERPVLCAFR